MRRWVDYIKDWIRVDKWTAIKLAREIKGFWKPSAKE
jgi:hypothetical protein